MDTRELRELASLPDSMGSKAVYNSIIRAYFPGGKELLGISERLHKALHGKTHDDPMLQALLDMSINARDQMVEAIQKSEDGILVKIPKEKR